MEPFIAIVDVPIDMESPGRPIPPNSGAVVEFYGIVRDVEDHHSLGGIEYEGFREMAIAELTRISLEVIQRYELTDLVCVHRVGYVPAQEPAVYVRTASKHREAAFRANMEFIELLKKSVPIWKHPVMSEPTHR